HLKNFITLTTNIRDNVIIEVEDIALMVDVDQDIIIMATMESITMAIGLTSMIATLMQDAVSHMITHTVNSITTAFMKKDVQIITIFITTKATIIIITKTTTIVVLTRDVVFVVVNIERNRRRNISKCN
ncbi:Hypothetical predicted protein, partial [Mytilus galloprovincialis]